MPINYEATKTLIKGLVQKMKSFRGNWEQNDPTADDYIKNRPFYTEGEKEAVIIPEMVVSIHSNYANITYSPIIPFEVGKTYSVLWNGDSYSCVANELNGIPCLGDFEFSSLPFCIAVDEDMFGGAYIASSTDGDYTVLVTGSIEVVHKIDRKYIDIPTNLATTDDIQTVANNVQTVANNVQTVANNVQTVANNVQTVANNVNKKMNATNPVGTGSFSMNRKAGTTVGSYSHAEGYNTTASGNYSHAEGGSTIAFSKYSHAEGYYTNASGENSHVEGCGTNASGMNQHVQGKYNELSSAYAHIVGNGTSNTARSNAHTLDWEGNAWFQGDVYVGGTGQDDETAERLAKMSDIPSIEGFASESYVDTKLASIVNSAPEALNTLDELAAALGDDSNFATTVTNQIASKQDAITGTTGQFVVIGADGKPTTKTIPYAEEATF